jgi:hypothetical protein
VRPASSTTPPTSARGHGSMLPCSRRSKGDGGGATRGAMAVAVADSTSTTMIHSSNCNPMATGSDLGLAFFYFLKIDFLCRLLTADTKNRLFFVSHIWYRLQ